MTRVLLVEDHALFREALASLLAHHPQMEVDQAGTLGEARQKLRGIDVVVLDIVLPDGDGIDLISELRACNSGASVLVLSASPDSANPDRALKAGADAVLEKVEAPFRIFDEIERIGGVN
ncbi:MAG TPA: response regulator transcription factor [Rubrobacter sp.]|nr:response regulator transcription factor [Rubrobacter sp.]